MNQMPENKKFANLIKADLQDFLTNDSRLKHGNGWFFPDYFVMNDTIWLDSDNENMEKAFKENAARNSGKRKEQWEKEKKEQESKGNFYHRDLSTALYDQKFFANELEQEDYQEIIRLIQQIKQLVEEKREQKAREIDEKLSNHSGLFYWGGSRGNTGHFSPPENSGSKWENRRGKPYYHFLKKRNEGETYEVRISSNHPALTTFSFENGFYWIAGIENLPYESDPSNDSPSSSHDWFAKWVSLTNNITITPYSENSETNYNPKPIKPNDKGEKNADNDLLLALIKEYFRKNNVKEITLENGKLTIIDNNNNNNNNLSEKELVNSPEELLKHYCEKHHKDKLTQQELGIFPVNNSTNTNNSSQPENKYLPLLIAGIVVAVIFGGIFLLLRKNKQKRS